MTAEPLLDRMAEAASGWLASLPPARRAKASYPFPAAEERTRWFYTPNEQGGLPLAEMDPVQQRLAHRLTASGLSEGGYAAASTIMGLENALDAVEGWRRRYPGRAQPRPRPPAVLRQHLRRTGGRVVGLAGGRPPRRAQLHRRGARCSSGPTRP